MSHLGAIELGGTKTVCAVLTEGGKLLGQTRFPTTTPDETLRLAAGFLLDEASRHGGIRAIGVGSFGPISIRRDAADFGEVLATPKRGWAGANVLHILRDHTSLPVSIDTDVNGALLAEMRWGAGQGLSDVVYATIGTGIGAGVMSGGRLVNGQGHPEIGHMQVPRLAEDADFAGTCPFHGAHCIEGLAAGPAIEARWGQPGASLPDTHEAWDLEARYLALFCVNLITIFAPQKIILGGGVMQQSQLFDKIPTYVDQYNAGYVDLSRLGPNLRDLIVPPSLGNDAGVLGAGLIAASEL